MKLTEACNVSDRSADGASSWVHKRLYKLQLDLESIVKASDIFLVTLDAERRVDELSSTLAALLNFTQDEIRGFPFMDLITTDIYYDVQEMIEEAGALNQWMSTAIPLYTKDARKIEVILHAIPFAANNKMHLVVQPRSVKDCDKSSFWMKVNMPALQVDGCDIITAWNDQMMEFSGFTEDDVIGLSFFDLLCKDTLCSVQCMLNTSREEAGPSICTVRFYTLEGVPKMAQMCALALRNKSGQVLGISIIIQAVVEEKVSFTAPMTADFSTCDLTNTMLSYLSEDSDVEEEWE